ncbi:MAG: hypothetical protein KC621_28990 [Myxococcales bacterium]|nr:hypothetical protein [Myxococcales bacterium]
MFLLAPIAAFAAQIDVLDVEVGRPSFGVVEGVVDVPLAEAVRVVMDCAGADGWFPDLRDSVVVSEIDGVVRCSGRTDLPWPVTDRVWQIDSHVEDRGDGEVWVPFALVEGSGNVTEMHGSYLLTALPDGRAHVRYEATVDIGFWIPDPLAQWATRRVLPAILDGMEQAWSSEVTLVAGL